MTSERLTALGVTLIVAAGLLVLMVKGLLQPTVPSDTEWPPRHHSEIEFAAVEEEPERFVQTYSMQGDDVTEPYDSEEREAAPSGVVSDQQTQTSHSPANRGNRQGREAQPKSSNRESEQQVRPTTNPGNTAPDPAQEAARAEAERQQRADRINEKTNRWNRGSGAGQGEGRTTETDGTNASNGPGGGSGHGMTLSVNKTFSTSKPGVLVFDVRVLPDGTVETGSVKLASRGNSGTAATDPATIRQATAAAAQCRFSRRTGETTTVPGRITFTIN